MYTPIHQHDSTHQHIPIHQHTPTTHQYTPTHNTHHHTTHTQHTTHTHTNTHQHTTHTNTQHTPTHNTHHHTTHNTHTTHSVSVNCYIALCKIHPNTPMTYWLDAHVKLSLARQEVSVDLGCCCAALLMSRVTQGKKLGRNMQGRSSGRQLASHIPLAIFIWRHRSNNFGRERAQANYALFVSRSFGFIDCDR